MLRSRPGKPDPIVVHVADDLTTSYPGHSLDEVIQEELKGYADRREVSLRRNPDVAAYLALEEDKAAWQGCKLLAILRPRAEGEPEVIRLDGGASSEEEGEAAPPPVAVAHSDPRDPPPWREYLVSTRDEEVGRHNGFGMSVEAVIDAEAASFLSTRQAAIAEGCVTEEEVLWSCPDRAIWKDDRLVASFRPMPGGEYLVERFDEPGPGPRVDPAEVERSDEERSVLMLMRVMGYREAIHRLTLAGRYAALSAGSA